ncbi:hypothetical protein DYJ42_02300 [Streptococcus constellatus]|uniref:Uncharacterized protein n=1 Tax=Streptococcus constellatus subsp. constellatus SK53 TaxID=1095730 RepID=A0AAD2SVY3_STRCV|nr:MULTISPECIES: hypothetical protein [Streptococcus]EID21025.1 hypothetical protein HMPREF1044_1222 [Streptococcus constellatus subsp. constellatus SK53]MDP1485781.1 hypothetical protein [Streptococcus constellatus]OFP93422.1 hypothetical protein HMPREF2963_06390 [Streptococcus sp. HMSC067A03]QQT05568.1 hypothetical protein I6J13_00040 [Streptococcus constellatus]RID95517.1 hypothetical protein DYJ42_02300 [Streptococcus constellatus]
MKSIYIVILKKRWYLFGFLIFIGFCMNLFLWNESSQLIRVYPALQILKKESRQNSYETVYNPSADSSGLVKDASKEERRSLYKVLSTYLRKLGETSPFYYQKLNYLKGGKLQPLTDSVLQSSLLSNDWDSLLLDNILIRRLEKQQAQELNAEFKKINFPITLRTLSKTYQSQHDYYITNFIFGISISSILFIFSSIIIYWLLGVTIKICQSEIKVLRLIGLSGEQISQNLSYLLIAPIIFAFLGFFVYVSILNIKFIWADYIYLGGLNILLFVAAFIISKRRLKGVLYDLS